MDEQPCPCPAIAVYLTSRAEMNLIPFCLRKLNYSILAILCWVSFSGIALAAEGESGESYGSSIWVLPYAYVILCVGLGMFVVCRSARRKDRAKPEPYDKISLLDREDGEAAVAQEKRHGIQRTKQESKEAKSALTMSIVGIFIVPMCVVGLIQGIKARKLIAQDRRLSGEDKAFTAIIVSVVGLALWLLIALVGLMMLLSGPGDSAPSSPDEPPAAEAPEEPGA